MFSVIKYIIIVGYGETGLCTGEYYDIQKNTWKEIKTAMQCRAKFTSVTTLDGQILIIGGKHIVNSL